MRPGRKIQRGFTLIEMIVVIVITGIIAGAVAIFLRTPVQGYMDSARRAEMTDIADTALRRIGRDLRTAVPNSIRVPNPAGINTYIEFLPTKDGGRYRADPAGGGVGCGAAGPELSFAAPDTCFEIVGPAITFAANDQIVVGSTQSSGDPPYDNTATGVLRAFEGTTGLPQSFITIPLVQLPAFAELPGQRFDIVPGDQQAVTYSCENVITVNGEGAGTLRRYWGYGFNVPQAAPVSLGGTNAVLANNVSDCNIVYDTYNQRSGLVAITLAITRSGESVRLYHEIHVNNIP